MIDSNEQLDKLKAKFLIHMMYEYPQIDLATRTNLAYELALTCFELIDHDRLFHQGTRTKACI